MANYTWYYVFAAELVSPYSLSASELPPSRNTFPASLFPDPSIAFQYTLDGKVTKSVEFGSSKKLDIAKCSKSDFQYWAIAQYLPVAGGIAILGELTKVVAVSETRYSDLKFSVFDELVLVKVVGAPDEVVMTAFHYRTTGFTLTVSCSIGPSGMNVISIRGDPHLARCFAV